MLDDSPRIRRARELRQRMTPAELALWSELRARRFGAFKFRRQHPLGPYVVDYFCRACLLIVELDGDSHVGREAADQIRQFELEQCGYRVLRFTNPEVYEDLGIVLDVIFEECVKRQRTARSETPSPPSPLPQSRERGETTGVAGCLQCSFQRR
jgi:very-short-patch-repair endonuclease